MADEVNVDNVSNEEVKTENDVFNNLQASAWMDEIATEQFPPQTNLHQEEVKADAPPTEDTEVLEPNAWLKQKWGWDTEEVADNEIKALREKAAKSFEYKNDDSRKIAEYINEGKEDELYKFLDIKKRVEKLSTAELTDKSIAAELVKFGIQKDNPTLNFSCG